MQSEVSKRPAPKRRKAESRVDPVKYNSVYLYYLKYNKNNTTDDPDEVRCYYYLDRLVAIDDIGKRIESLVTNAYFDGGNPAFYGDKFTDLVRRRKGYFVVAVSGRKFSNKPFTISKRENRGPDTSADYTFDPAQRLTVPVKEPNGTTVTVDVGYCVSRLQSKKKQTMGNPGDLDDKEHEAFNVVLSFAGRRFYPDSGGTNMGPPLGPP